MIYSSLTNNDHQTNVGDFSDAANNVQQNSRSLRLSNILHPKTFGTTVGVENIMPAGRSQANKLASAMSK
jgi:hypothetical protein